MKFWSLIFLVIAQRALAAECPWIRSEGKDLLKFDSDQSIDRPLSAEQVKEDLSCLKILFENFYVARLGYPNIDIIQRLELEIAKADQTTSKNLMKRIFKLHEDMVDIHLNYSIWTERDSVERFSQQSNDEVTLDRQYNEENIIENSKYIYFRPGSLVTHSKVQDEFISRVKETDKNLVIDLRGNPGGENYFGFALARALYTKDQKIPVATKLQVHSPLQRIGFGLTLLTFGHELAETAWSEVTREVEKLSFSEMLRYEIRKETEELIGERPAPFKSKVVLITDGGCISACETVVEKLSFLPNVKRVGANTAGGIHYSNAMTFILPNSGIVADIPSLHYQYEVDAPEGVGYPVDEHRSFVKLDNLFK